MSHQTLRWLGDMFAASRQSSRTGVPSGFRFRPRLESLADRCTPALLFNLDYEADPVSTRSFGTDAIHSQELDQFWHDYETDSPPDQGDPANDVAAMDAANIGGTVTPSGQQPGEDAEVKPGSTRIGGPGRYNYPDGSMVFVSDKTPDGDANNIRRVAPEGTTVYENVVNWTDIRRGLANVPAGTVGGLVISGHGLSDDGGEVVGVQSSNPHPSGVGGLYGILSKDLDPNTLDVINSRLTPGAPIILASCSAGRCVPGLQVIADATGHPVIATAGHCGDGNNSDGDWVQVAPFVGPPAPLSQPNH